MYDLHSENQRGNDESSQNLNRETSRLCVICTLKFTLAVTGLEPGRVRIVRGFRSENQTGIDESSQNLNQERSGLCMICTLKIRLALPNLNKT